MTSAHAPPRRAVVAGMIGAGASLVMPAGAVRAASGPPQFGTIRHQFTQVEGARPVPQVAIPVLAGGALDLTAFKGRMVLVNFWATWCAACRTELPMLDRLAASGRSDLVVVAVSTDRNRAPVAPYVKQLKLRHLAIGFDPGGLVSRVDAAEADTPFALYGMPITFLIGVTGQVEGYMTGEADWLSTEASGLFDYYAAGGR
ncbi:MULTISPECIES: TlpA family protein disulfide reductase [Bradyrhizobium]|jgi:thiol-disulfide isomerase/thioredoxin|uniref:TlpA family protein disulfide reductase n=1 Tax=Bradyrhizobium TaxID=374 RepID=UPI0004B6CC66|nr:MULTISPECIES: TlpA disulfide reductase family protein [Bradyrhizobium]MCS3445758.1 thiol-disulfide isomerase/thioredoxin [Bradyrhizobium elkanii]MCS3563111.1 thiol-disulfide isomerase/thioredoxin [Bradyrhizobium elkanii]MCW2147054.1 thiol-disulfide isomerase/thioredoxin [Bradyrhizobium elkanii]MCW2353871.1 thiol-disulfide isomerase/thioredoxin [Bradyrhizobium elkanii]MCW2379884.1 thiol-disulfide isomerase/thioredoxin [Bradyrhizobium elkanii]